METYDSTLAPRFSQLLAQREAELRAILRGSGDQAEPGDLSRREVTDFKDIAGEEARAELDHVKVEHAAVELEQVQAARRRLQDQTYGHCLDCGMPIDLRRLIALPATRYCTRCQSLHEQARPGSVRRGYA